MAEIVFFGVVVLLAVGLVRAIVFVTRWMSR